MRPKLSARSASECMLMVRLCELSLVICTNRSHLRLNAHRVSLYRKQSLDTTSVTRTNQKCAQPSPEDVLPVSDRLQTETNTAQISKAKAA